MKTKVLITGGTIDKVYNPISGQLNFQDSVVPQTLALFAPQSTSSEILFLVDSLEMTDSHRQQIVSACQNASENSLLLTHGTDTMVQTALYLEKAKLKKTIILTGAMIPIRIANSDGPQNLAFALGALSQLKEGVYIAMGGKVFPANNCQKDTSLGIFTSLNT